MGFIPLTGHAGNIRSGKYPTKVNNIAACLFGPEKVNTTHRLEEQKDSETLLLCQTGMGGWWVARR